MCSLDVENVIDFSQSIDLYSPCMLPDIRHSFFFFNSIGISWTISHHYAESMPPKLFWAPARQYHRFPLRYEFKTKWGKKSTTPFINSLKRQRININKVAVSKADHEQKITNSWWLLQKITNFTNLQKRMSIFFHLYWVGSNSKTIDFDKIWK